MRRAAFVVPAIVLIAAGAVLLRYTVFFHPRAFLFERGREKTRLFATSSRWPPPDAAKRFHQGAGPCLAYASAEELATPEEDAAALDELQQAALLENLDLLAPVLRHWSQEDERARHGELSDDEALLPFSTEPSVSDRLALAFHAHELAELQRAQMKERAEIVAHEADAASARLPPTTRDVLESIWTRHRDALSPKGRVLTRSAWKIRVTRVHLERIRAALEAFHAVYKKCPVALDDLDEKVATSSLVDGFGRSFDYQKRDGGCRVVSLGFDGYPGGFGPSEDVQIEVGMQTAERTP